MTTGTNVDPRPTRAPRPFEDFAWTPENEAEAQRIVARYPTGRQHSAIMPLLFLAQRQVGQQSGGGEWLPVPVIEYVAKYIDMPYIRAYEVATFYTMYNLKPVGRVHVQVCGTTPCMLRGAEEIMAACKEYGLKKGEVTHDGLFTLSEVECLGACVNAPMAQINDDYYEDLDRDSMRRILEAFSRGETPKPGPQIDRQLSAPVGGPTTLRDMMTAEEAKA